MTEVWFYVTRDASAGARALLLKKLLERAWSSPRQLYLHTTDASAATRLDDWLWQPATSFLPHGLTGDPAQRCSIGHAGNCPAQGDILFNLSDQVPSVCAGFARVVELVSGSDNDTRQGRERWRQYRELGYPVTKHELGSL